MAGSCLLGPAFLSFGSFGQPSCEMLKEKTSCTEPKIGYDLSRSEIHLPFISTHIRKEFLCNANEIQ